MMVPVIASGSSAVARKSGGAIDALFSPKNDRSVAPAMVDRAMKSATR